MLISASLTAPGRAMNGFACTVAAHATVDIPLEAIPAWRENPGSDTSPPLPPRFLRHADEQTVVGLAAVLRAMTLPPLAGTDFAEWGVLAAPRFQGRLGGAATLNKFVQQGSAAVSPHAIPQYSLHSISSAISVALGMRGPNFGIGGGSEDLGEGLTVALTYLQCASAPGMWLVLTQWDVEPIPDGAGGSATPAVCRGTALALVPAATGRARLRLPPSRTRHPAKRLAAWLANSPVETDEERWSLPLSWGGQIEFIVDDQVQQRKAA